MVCHPAPFDPGEYLQPFFAPLAACEGAAPTAVRSLMTRQVQTCRPDDTFATAARTMFESGCHYLPVVDRIGHPIGAVTDSDLRAFGFREDRGLGEMLVRDAMGASPVTCREDEDACAALHRMRERRTRDLPVVDGDGVLCGILSLSDLVLWAEGLDSVPLRREAAAAISTIVRHRARPGSGSRNPATGT